MEITEVTDYFDEIGLFIGRQHTWSVRSTTHTDLYKLPRHEFERVIRSYPASGLGVADAAHEHFEASKAILISTHIYELVGVPKLLRKWVSDVENMGRTPIKALALRIRRIHNDLEAGRAQLGQKYLDVRPKTVPLTSNRSAIRTPPAAMTPRTTAGDVPDDAVVGMSPRLVVEPASACASKVATPRIPLVELAPATEPVPMPKVLSRVLEVGGDAQPAILTQLVDEVTQISAAQEALERQQGDLRQRTGLVLQRLQQAMQQPLDGSKQPDLETPRRSRDPEPTPPLADPSAMNEIHPVSPQPE